MDDPLPFPVPAPPRLRTIRDGAHDAAFNMAADRYLLGCAAEKNLVILRTYSWTAPTITLGCMQRPEGLLDEKAMVQAGVGWISRITGGRAVLHWNDLTYSCAFPSAAAAMGRSIAESYAMIGRCLSSGLAAAGIVTEMHDSPAEHRATMRNLRLPCFCSPSRNELMVRGKKLVGSAQKRTRSGVLQHGSIPLDDTFSRLGEFMAATTDERDRLAGMLRRKCTWVGEWAPGVGREFLAECIMAGFAGIVGLEAVEEGWTGEEMQEINR
jgi:lipoate-protein ligase A